MTPVSPLEGHGVFGCFLLYSAGPSSQSGGHHHETRVEETGKHTSSAPAAATLWVANSMAALVSLVFSWLQWDGSMCCLGSLWYTCGIASTHGCRAGEDRVGQGHWEAGR